MKKWLTDLFTNKKQRYTPVDILHEEVTAPPLHPPTPQLQEPKKPDVAVRVAGLLDRIAYVHPSPEIQLAKRLEGYEGLATLGNDAIKAIPNLIRKYFSENPTERDRARDTLVCIDPEWPKTQQAAEMIPYLIKKLEKEHLESRRAIDILINMGSNIHDPLLVILQSPAQDDQDLKVKSLMLLCKTGATAEQLYPLIQPILANPSSDILLEECLETVQLLGKKDDTLAGLIAGFLDHKNESVREKSISALQACTGHAESFVPELLKCLADPSDVVRGAAVQLLSAFDTEALSGFLKEVVANQGDLKEDEMKVLFQKLKFWLGDSVTQRFQINSWQLWNNLSWYGLEIKNELGKKELLLESSLNMLANLKYAGPDLVEPVMNIYRKHDRPDIQFHCVRFLGNLPADTAGILPFLLLSLKNPHEKVRQSGIVSMNQMDSNWINRPEMQQALRELIEELDGNQQKAVREALLSLGSITVPALGEYLEQTGSRVLQQAVIDILSHLDISSGISPATLHRVYASCQNAHTREALNELIKRLEG